MTRWIMALTCLCGMLCGELRAEEPDAALAWPPTFRQSRVAVTLGGWHATTRGTIRLVFPHETRWLVFHGNPDTYHFSSDGVSWTSSEAAQAGRSHLLHGNTITSFYSVTALEGPPKWVFDKYVARGTIADTSITWQRPVKLDTRIAYYPDLRQTTEGHFTMTGRDAVRNDKDEVVGTEVLWQRTRRPNDVTEWEPEVRCIHHVGDAHTGDPNDWKRIGSTAHENLVLEDGKSCVIAMMTSGGVGRLLANVHDGKRWGTKDLELATGMSTWAGTDRRMCAVFDRKARVIHLAWVDGDGTLWYRRARTPYEAKDWSAPVRLQPFKTFAVVVGLDSSQTPAQVYVLFGRTRFENRSDLRSTYGELFLQRLEGETWREPLRVSEPDTTDNWYPNMNEDVRHGIGVLYLKGSGRTQTGKPPLDIMFSSTGPPRR